MKAQQEREYVAYVTGRLATLRRVATQLAGDPHRGDDLVQQAITKLYAHWKRASQAHDLDAYTHKILVRAFLDERRLKWAGVRLVDTTPDRPDEHLSSVEDQLLLRHALAGLPPRQRAAVVLRYLADRPVEEVAEILGVSPGTVKSQTADALANLRRLLTDRPATDELTHGSKLTPGALT